MGVSGLLPFVKKACRKGSIQEFSDKTLAVDVSYLLHRGVFGCAGQIATGKSTDFYIGYVRKYVDILLRAGCHVVLVFDGQPLPAKKEINDARRAIREKNSRLGHELTRQGLHNEAYRAFQQAVTITAEIVVTTIRAFRDVPLVDVIVAPYEADAQIAYLVQSGLAYAAVTEDSDLIVFGCERIVFKLDTSGVCLVYDRQRLPGCVCPAIGRRFEFAIFRRICILAGCDYLQGGLQGVGLKKAELFFAKTSQTDLNVLLPKVPLYLNLSNVKVDCRFIAEFIKAENTFLYQVVFDPINQRHVALNPPPTSLSIDGSEDSCGGEAIGSATKSLFDYAGEFLTPAQAVRRALGNVDLTRPSALDEFVLPAVGRPTWSLWSGERFLRERTEKLAKRQTSAYEKLGAFASKCSPRKVRHKGPLTAVNRILPVGKSVTQRVQLDGEKHDGCHSTTLPALTVLDDDNEDDGDSGKENEKDGVSSSRKRKCHQRRSEPLTVLGGTASPKKSGSSAGQRRFIVIPNSQQHRNDAQLSWNSADWMRMYSVNSAAEKPTNKRERQSPAFHAMTIAQSSMTSALTSSSTNPFARTTVNAALPRMDGEATSPTMKRAAADRSFDEPTDRLLSGLLADSPRSMDVQPSAVEKRRSLDGRRSIVSGLSSTRVRHTLVGLFTSATAESSSQSSLFSDMQPAVAAAESQSSSSSSGSSTCYSQVTLLESATLSQEVFYRRRNSFSQQLAVSAPSPVGEQQTAVNVDDANGADKKNLLAGSESLVATTAGVEEKATAPIAKPRVSPYFLPDGGWRLTAVAAYCPSSLRTRAAAFPRVL